jgi:hypothetical protein
MAENKGKPSGKFAEDKTDPGRKSSEVKRTGWPEDFPTQNVEDATGQQQGKPRNDLESVNHPGVGRGRNRKAGSP